jgi:hypothetical protein
MKLTFTTAQMAKILKKSQRFCISWTELGIFVADLQPAAGYASRREFSYAGLLRAYLAVHLQSKYGFKREKVRNLIKAMWDQEFFQAWAHGFLPVFAGSLEEERPLKLLSDRSLEQLSERPGSGWLMIIDAYEGGSAKVTWGGSSIALTLSTLKGEDIAKMFSGAHDCLILNLLDLKREIDERIRAAG